MYPWASGEEMTAAKLKANAGDYQTAGGTGNAITLTSSVPVAAYTAGDCYVFKAAAANTGATTLNVSSLGAKSVLKHGDEALVANDIKSGDVVVCIYDGTQFQMVSSGGIRSASGSFTYSKNSDGTTENDDLTITTGFRPRVICINYWLSGHDSAASTADYKYSIGRAVFQGTTQVGKYALGENLEGTGTEATSVAGSLLSINRDFFDSASAPFAGQISGTNAHHIQFTINSISATAFVVRRTTQSNSVDSIPARMHATWEAYA